MGCDEPAEDVVFQTTCSACDKDPDCPVCEGEGFKEWHRCPNAVLEAEPEFLGEIEDAMLTYANYHAHHTLPAPGGVLDQTTSFLRFSAIVDGERAVWDEARREADK